MYIIKVKLRKFISNTQQIRTRKLLSYEILSFISIKIFVNCSNTFNNNSYTANVRHIIFGAYQNRIYFFLKKR